jgi:hypothetical protein
VAPGYIDLCSYDNDVLVCGKRVAYDLPLNQTVRIEGFRQVVLRGIKVLATDGIRHRHWSFLDPNMQLSHTFATLLTFVAIVAAYPTPQLLMRCEDSCFARLSKVDTDMLCSNG